MWMAIGLKLAQWFAGNGLQSLMSTATDVYKARLAAGNDHDKLAADLAARQLQLDARDADLQAKLTTEGRFGPRELIGYSVAFYVAKILVWDKQHYDYTDPLDDRMYWVVTTCIVAYFGARTVRDVVSQFRRRT